MTKTPTLARLPLAEALRAASEALLGDDLETSLASFLEAASRAVGAEAASIILVDKSTRELFFAAATGEKAESLINQRIGERQGVAGRTVATGEAVLLNNLAEEQGVHCGKVDENTGFRTRHIIACPLRHGDFRFGVIELVNSLEGGFTKTDLEAAWILANMVSAAIWQSRAYARAFSALAIDRAEYESGSPMIGRSETIRKLLDFIPRVAASNAPVLIRGESGVGKEVLARIIWKASKRSKKIFLATNCAAIPPTLIESELFGHERGAFTGAHQLRVGRFEAAHKGTLFLDEIGELPPEMQAKLLRVLQEMEFTRVGGTKPIKVDVRVLAATNRDLEKAVKQSGFREDLYYRLNVIPCSIPPLRDRREDIIPLTEYFIAQFNESMGRAVEGLTPQCRDLLERYDWPGNARELRNVIERLMVLSDNTRLDEVLLPAEIKESTPIGKKK